MYICIRIRVHATADVAKILKPVPQTGNIHDSYRCIRR